ncbi:MAG: hypothetical protein A2381_14850 [Bdellovibrionales bacterium RIFOXYB1_FULL_37_110]|nr:MAG: hypothetical protein A2417_10355 [Bdellovibrionales bacterium RIFOXYC1_FULL_37_79]OFZ60143.1 MAG: hypothetical protein A2381_14850 [Bdellovibrionales bacterium RIFOXYB1_FULL_37_110]OFZ64363.1 MAG: hypothetical protein A2577_09920 [Bdellovibrionales bacterium RIFOXYD1_FULL_36_51]
MTHLTLNIRKKSLLYLLLLFGLLLTLFPFLWMISTSFKPENEIFQKTINLLPASFTFEHYLKLFKEINFGKHFINSLIVSLGITGFSVVINSMAAYAFAKIDFPQRNRLFLLLLITMMVPMQTTMIPSFYILKKMGLLNTFSGLIIPAGASVYGIFLIRQFMFSIPNSLIEAARIDGCSEWYIFWKIIIPLSRPILATITIFTFLSAWNEFLFPLIILREEAKYTLPLALATLNGQFNTDWGLLMAGSVVVIIPVIIVFLLVQKHYIKGLTAGSVKG